MNSSINYLAYDDQLNLQNISHLSQCLVAEDTVAQKEEWFV